MTLHGLRQKILQKLFPRFSNYNAWSRVKREKEDKHMRVYIYTTLFKILYEQALVMDDLMTAFIRLHCSSAVHISLPTGQQPESTTGCCLLRMQPVIGRHKQELRIKMIRDMAAAAWGDAKGALAQKFALQIPAINNGSVSLQPPSPPPHLSNPLYFPCQIFCLTPTSSLGQNSSCKMSDT